MIANIIGGVIAAAVGSLIAFANYIFSKKVLFLGKNRGHGLHFATVASGELVKYSADQGGVRRYNCVVKCEGIARTHDQIFLKKNAKKVHFIAKLVFFFFFCTLIMHTDRYEYKLWICSRSSSRPPHAGGRLPIQRQ